MIYVCRNETYLRIHYEYFYFESKTFIVRVGLKGHISEDEIRRSFFLCFQQPQQEEVKAVETKQESSGDSPAEVAEVTTPTEATPASPNTATSPDNKETKKKDKVRRLASELADPGLINPARRQINKLPSCHVVYRDVFVCQSVVLATSV